MAPNIPGLALRPCQISSTIWILANLFSMRLGVLARGLHHNHLARILWKKMAAASAAAFLRLVSRVIATGIHEVADVDSNPAKQTDGLVRRWVQKFGGVPDSIEIEGVHRCFEGIAIVRVRATVAHDSYERLVEVPCA